MRKIIIGLLTLLTGVFFSYRILSQEDKAEQQISFYERPAPSLSLAFSGYLIPAGIIILAAGAGDILSKKRKKKRNYPRIIKL